MWGNSTKTRLLIAGAIAAAGSSLFLRPVSIDEPKRPSRRRPLVYDNKLSAKQAEIKAWNDAVDARKQAKKGGA